MEEMRKEQETLILKYIGQDDFSCPTYKDQNGKLWKDSSLGNAVVPELYSVSGNEIDGEPEFPISTKKNIQFDPKPYRKEPDELTYRLLSRMKSDCEYFLGYGGRNPRQLWGTSVEGHIKEMRRLWESLPEHGKPEWLTDQDITEYEKKMLEE